MTLYRKFFTLLVKSGKAVFEGILLRIFLEVVEILKYAI